MTYHEEVEAFKRKLLMRTLKRAKTVTKAAAELGMARTNLHGLLKRYGYTPHKGSWARQGL